MTARIIEILSGFIVATISLLGYSGIVLLMAIESACVPLPSEIIMPFSGYLVSTGQMNLWLVGLAGAVGCVLGSLVAYWVGTFGGRPLIEKYGRIVLVSRHDLDMADRWFANHGEIIVFVSRLLPAIRTFIAFPAGVARMNLKRFVIYRFAAVVSWARLHRSEAWLKVESGRHTQNLVSSLRFSNWNCRGVVDWLVDLASRRPPAKGKSWRLDFHS